MARLPSGLAGPRPDQSRGTSVRASPPPPCGAHVTQGARSGIAEPEVVARIAVADFPHHGTDEALIVGIT